jgi:hypothetical protein
MARRNETGNARNRKILDHVTSRKR